MQNTRILCLAFLSTIFCLFLSLPTVFSQTLGEESRINANWEAVSCGEQLMHERKMANDEDYRHQVERTNEQLYQEILRQQKSIGVEKNSEECGFDNQDSEVLIIPLVIHIVHLSNHITPGTGSSNPSDAQILQGVVDINHAFRNIEYYKEDGRGAKNGSNPDRNLLKSQDVKIEFRLARRDIYGNSSPGVLRYESDVYSDLNSMRDSELKRWVAARNNEAYPTTDYANIYLVNKICDGDPDNPSNCTTAGYAYLAGAHGTSFDGVVNMARFFGSSKRNSVVHIHEFGHYLNLSHTFDGGCENDNCLLDGDRVCDTPPDDSTERRSCGGSQNSCGGDTDSGPFTRDQEDMYENYMDYADWTCQNTFTQGQKDRMRSALQGIRSSLLRSEGSIPVVSDIAEVVSVSNPSIIACEQVTIPTIEVENKGNSTISSLKIQYELNGSIRLFNWQGNISAGATRGIDLPQISLNNLGVYSLYIKLLESNGNAIDENTAGFCHDFNYAGAISQLPFCEDLESGDISNNWVVSNPDSKVGFQIKDINTCEGKGNFVLALQTWGQFPNRNTTESVYTQAIDLRDYDAAFFEFDVAYATTFPNFNTILEVAVSTDCGNSYQIFYSKTADQLATKNIQARNSTDNNAFFVPSDCSDWKGELVDLSDFAGQKINIRIQASTEKKTNSTIYEWGNNLYLDNFCINAERCTPPNSLTTSPLAICGNLQLEATTTALSGNQIIAWWINNSNPITNIVNNQNNFEGAVSFTSIGNATGLAGEGNIIFRSNIGAGKLNIPVDCEKFRSGTTYYATPFVINSDFSNPTFNACTFGTPVAFSCDCDNVSDCDLRLTGTSIQNNSGCGLQDGAITILSNASNDDIEYSINGINWQPNNRFQGLASGTYNAFIRNRTDQNCIKSAGNVVVGEPIRPEITNLIVTPPNDCEASSVGQIEVKVDGNIEIEYRLDSGDWQSSPIIGNLVAGTYSVQVRNKTAKTCISDARSATLTAPSTDAIDIVEVQQSSPSACGANDGNITIITNAPMAEYSIDGGINWQNSKQFTQLIGGTYYPEIRSGKCAFGKGEAVTLVSENTGIKIEIDVISDPICKGQENDFSFTISGGISPYKISYRIGQEERVLENYSNNEVITFIPNNVLATISLRSITDAKGCMVESSQSEILFTARCGGRNNLEVVPTEFLLYPNAPNPFQETTRIRFDLPEADRVMLSIYNLTGQLIHRKEKDFSAGYHEWEWKTDELSNLGVLYYQIQTSNDRASGKMVSLE